MGKNRGLFALLVLVMSFQATEQKKLLILDTSGTTAANYCQLSELATSVGFITTFANLYAPPGTLTSYDAVFLFLDNFFLQNTLSKNNNPLIERIMSLVKNYIKKENGLLALLFPGQIPQNKNTTNALCSFFEIAEISPTICATIQDLSPCIFSTDTERSSTYTTALYPRRNALNITPKTKRCNLSLLPKMKHPPITLPIGNPESYLSSIVPLGIYIQPKDHCALFLGPDSSFNGAELEENIFFSPATLNDREKFLKTVHETLWQIHHITIHDTLPQKSSINTLPPTVMPIMQLNNKKQKKIDYKHSLLKKFSNQSILCGWMEIEPFKDNWQKAVTSIKESGLNLLWFSLNPEWYLSKQATRTKEEFTIVEEGITEFTHELTNQFSENYPAIFVGFDLTNNFRTVKLEHSVQDVYGKNYTKIPSIFDQENFWQQEFILPLKNFVERWKKLSQKVDIAGIFIDFEMYHAPEQTGLYTNLMDFSDLAWNVYAKKKDTSTITTYNTVEKRVKFLFKNNLFEDYFTTLEEAAKELGIMIKKEIKNNLPEALIGVYLPSLRDCWVYRGICAGLSSEEEPIILATFNTNYYGHTKWAIKHNIYALHLPVMMLSHIQTPQTQTELITFHDGVWFNRFSRLFEPCRKSDWYRLECSQEKPSLVLEHIKSYTKR